MHPELFDKDARYLFVNAYANTVRAPDFGRWQYRQKLVEDLNAAGVLFIGRRKLQSTKGGDDRDGQPEATAQERRLPTLFRTSDRFVS